MNKIIKIIGQVSMVAVTGLLVGSCVSNPDSSGLEYMPDMYRSPAVEPYVDYGEVRGRVDEDKAAMLSALTPPRNTIPYYGANKEEVMYMLPYKRLPAKSFKTTHGLYGWEFSDSDVADYEYNLAAADKNPLTLTAENAEMILKKGKTLYVANCMHCHGEKGDGEGSMVKSGAYTGVPNYGDKKALGDGQLFYSIYYGKGVMGSHASLLNKKEIWTLVHNIRKFQNADYGKFSEDGSAMAVEKMDSLVPPPAPAH